MFMMQSNADTELSFGGNRAPCTLAGQMQSATHTLQSETSRVGMGHEYSHISYKLHLQGCK